MTSLNTFDSSVQCEEFYTVDPQEMAEILAAPDDAWVAYGEWSREVETSLAPSTLYIDPKDGKVNQIPEPPSKGRFDGIEL